MYARADAARGIGVGLLKLGLENLDRRTAPVQLVEILRRRYLWDWLKLVVAIGYPITRVALFAFHPELPTWLPLTTLLDAPSLGSIGVALVVAYLQWRNIRVYRDDVLPKAGRVAHRYGRRKYA
jgi:hypothetical protein